MNNSTGNNGYKVAFRCLYEEEEEEEKKNRLSGEFFHRVFHFGLFAIFNFESHRRTVQITADD